MGFGDMQKLEYRLLPLIEIRTLWQVLLLVVFEMQDDPRAM